MTRVAHRIQYHLTLITADQMPPEEQMGEVPGDTIMHASLTIGDDLLMGSDDPTTDQFGPVQGMVVSYSATDVDAANSVFEALADGGEVRMPIGATSFSPAFGMCVDRFGTPWMVGAEGQLPDV